MLFSSSFLAVNLFRSFELRLGYFEIVFIFHRAKKTGLITFMASRTGLFDLNKQRVAVAIERNIFHGLGVAALFAFPPKLLARPTPKMRLARLDGFLQGRAVHPRHHQHAASFLFLHDCGNQTIHSEVQFFKKAHSQLVIADVG